MEKTKINQTKENLYLIEVEDQIAYTERQIKEADEK